MQAGEEAAAKRRHALPGASEETIHRAVVAHLNLRGVAGLVFFHPANGELRRKATGGRLKALGVRAGVADLVLLHRGIAYALEIKRAGGRVQESQDDFLDRWVMAGGRAAVCYGLDEALAQLSRWELIKGDD